MFFFLFLWATFCDEYFLKDYFSPALYECINEGIWDDIVDKYYTTAESRPTVPTAVLTPWPSGLSKNVRKMMEDTIEIGVFGTNDLPYFHYDNNERVWDGIECDLFTECVRPKVQEKYGLSDSEFKYHIDFVAVKEDTFFEYVYCNLEGDTVDMMFSVTYRPERELTVDFTHQILSNENVCVYARSYNGTAVPQNETIFENPETIIKVQIGTITDFIVKRFPNCTIVPVAFTEEFFTEIEGNAKAHVYCAEEIPVLYWLDHEETTIQLVDQNWVNSPVDQLHWATKKYEIKTRSYVWAYVSSVLFALFLLFFVFSCLFILIFLSCGIPIFAIFYKMNKRLRKFKGLGEGEDLYYLLEEAKVMERTAARINRNSKSDHNALSSLRHIKINKDLFLINKEDFRLIRILGEGGSGQIVYLAQWSSKNVAFKAFRSRQICSNQNQFNEFEKEVSILASVHHPFIIQYYGSCLSPPRIGYIMEYGENGDLFNYISLKKEKKELFSWKRKLRILYEISSAMIYLHSKKIIHRDLKLENILLTENLTSKLMDFGISKLYTLTNAKKTKRVGTSFYMSPEVVLGQEYTSKVDVFSFGILMYYLVTERINEHLYPNDGNLYNIEYRVANDPNLRPQFFIEEEKKEEKENAGEEQKEEEEEEKSKKKKKKSQRIIKCLIKHDIPRNFVIQLITNCWSHHPSDRKEFVEIFKILKKREKSEKRKEEISTDIIDSDDEDEIGEYYIQKKKRENKERQKKNEHQNDNNNNNDLGMINNREDEESQGGNDDENAENEGLLTKKMKRTLTTSSTSSSLSLHSSTLSPSSSFSTFNMLAKSDYEQKRTKSQHEQLINLEQEMSILRNEIGKLRIENEFLKNENRILKENKNFITE